MTGKEFVKNHEGKILDYYQMSDFKLLNQVEWFARSFRSSNSFKSDTEIIMNWGKWFKSKKIPWLIVDTPIGVSLYKEPFSNTYQENSS